MEDQRVRRIDHHPLDGTIRIWSTESQQQIGRELPDHGISNWSPDGKLVAVAEEQGVRVWNMDMESWPDIACQMVGRNMTEAEWDEFGPNLTDYRPRCAQYSIGP